MRHDKIIHGAGLTVVFLNTEVREVDVLVTEVFQSEVAATHLHVGTLENIDIKWFPRSDESPLPDIEFLLIDEVWVLYVFLYYFRLSLLTLLNNIFKFIGAIDTNASSIIGRLDHPHVLCPIYPLILLQVFLKLKMHLYSLDLFIHRKPRLNVSLPLTIVNHHLHLLLSEFPSVLLGGGLGGFAFPEDVGLGVGQAQSQVVTA